MRRNPNVWIYALVDPRDQSVRYVGRSRHPIVRFYGHVSKGTLAYAGANKRLYGWIEDLATAGVRPMLLLIERVPMKSAGDGERRWIDHFRPTGLLFNSTVDRTKLIPVNRFRTELSGALR